MHIMDILQNSIRAGASSVQLDIVEDTNEQTLSVTLTDNGKGMSEEMAARATDPFFTTRTTRPVGLGLSLLKQNAERTGGRFSLESREGQGTRVCAGFRTCHPDRLVFGDVPGVVMLVTSSNPGIRVDYSHDRNGRVYKFSSGELREALEGINLSEPSVYRYVKEMITENLNEIGVELTS
jgi:hypothetical protein